MKKKKTKMNSNIMVFVVLCLDLVIAVCLKIGGRILIISGYTPTSADD